MSSMRIINLNNLQQFTAVNLLLDPGAIGGPKIIPQAAQIDLAWNLGDGKRGHNVLIGRYSGAFSGSAAQANSIVTGLTTGANWTALAAFLASTASLQDVTIRDLNTRDQPIISNTVAGQPGTSASPELPNEVALVVTLRTAFTGAQNRGRMFIPGFATNALGTSNQANPATLTALRNWAGTIAGILSAQGYIWCVGHVHRQAYTGTTGTSHADRPAGTVPIQIVDVRDGHWDTQRRRGLK